MNSKVNINREHWNNWHE